MTNIDKYNYIIDLAYRNYNVIENQENYIKALDYSLKLSLIQIINKLSNIVFENIKDIVYIDDINLFGIELFQHIFNRISNDSGINYNINFNNVYMNIKLQLDMLITNSRNIAFDKFMQYHNNNINLFKFRFSKDAKFNIELY